MNLNSFLCCIGKDKESRKNKNKITLLTQERLKTDKHNVFIKEINKIILISNDVKEFNQLIRKKICIWNEKSSCK